jgi:hypothetical protein
MSQSCTENRRLITLFSQTILSLQILRNPRIARNVDHVLQPAGRIRILKKWREVEIFIYRRPTLYPLEIAVDFLKSL